MINAVHSFLSNMTLPESNMQFGMFGFQSHIEIHDSKVTISLDVDAPNGLFPSTLTLDIVRELKNQWPTYTFEVTINHIIQTHQTQMPGKSLRQVKNTIAIASGKGGVGKSTVTVNLAAALVKAGARVGILDADIYGPSIPLMLGQTSPVTIDNERYVPVNAHGLQAMSIGYLTKDSDALIWRGPMLAKALIQMLDITAWDNLDYLFIDLPPGTGDIQLSLVQKIPLTGAIIVTTPQDLAILDAEKALKMFKRTQIDVFGIIENMSLHTCSACGHQDTLFGQGGAKSLCEANAVPLLGQLPLHGAIRTSADNGLPIALNTNDALSEPWRQIALHFAAALSKKPLISQQ